MQVCLADTLIVLCTTVTGGAVVAVSVRYMIDEINTSVFVFFAHLNRSGTDVGKFYESHSSLAAWYEDVLLEGKPEKREKNRY